MINLFNINTYKIDTSTFSNQLHDKVVTEFENKVKSQKSNFVKEITSSFYSGDFMILKNAFSSEFLNALKIRLMDYSKKSSSSFYKMKEGCPDFHRIQNESQLGKYSVDAVRHSFYFFNWNVRSDSKNVMELFVNSICFYWNENN